jgi:phosphohistidine phosphatase
MKRLLILRHAKAKRGPDHPIDYERPLAKRGKEDAKRMGAELLDRGLAPDLIISSPARRARQTARRLAKAAELDRDAIEYQDSLYFEGTTAILDVISQLGGDARVLMVVGHNPTLEELLACVARHYLPLTTCSVAIVEYASDGWENIEESTGDLRAVLSPDQL